jgi:hypothetical protein
MNAKAMASKLALAAPKGWSAKAGSGYHDGLEAWPQQPGEWVRFERDGVSIVLNVSVPRSRWDRESSFRGLLVEGHTVYDGRCFTRRGVDTYSCRLTSREGAYAHVYWDLASLLAGEYARCVEARGRANTSVPVPGLPFRVQPEWFAKSAETLKAGRMVSLTPGGLGTGYTLSTLGRGRRALKALEEKLGVSPVFVETFDHD